MAESETDISALKYHWVTRLHDPIMRLLPEDIVLERLDEEADLQPGEQVLDLECGTDH